MNYINNIKVNLNKQLYNFYEWESTDNIKLLNTVEVFFVDKKTYADIFNMSALFYDNNFKNNICIFSTDVDSLCVEIKNFKVSRISKLLLEDEKKVLMLSHKRTKINYKKINGSNNYSYKTREQQRNINEIITFLDKEKQNNDLINYIYFELFHNLKCKNKYNKIKNYFLSDEINYENVNKILELINV